LLPYRWEFAGPYDVSGDPEGETMLCSRSSFFALFLALSVFEASAIDQPPSPQRAKVIELMELTGANSIGVQVGQLLAQQMFNAMQQANPTIPKRAHEIIRDVTMEIVKQHSQELLTLAIPLYEKHFTENELDDLIAFYRTPTGQKAVKELPALMQEFVPISQSWALGLQPEMRQKLHDRLAAEGLLH